MPVAGVHRVMRHLDDGARRTDKIAMTISVLLADDHAVVRDGLHALLEAEADIRVIGHADDGIAAFDNALRLRPDVVLMDIAMPRLGGIEAAARLHARLPEIAVVILSMHLTSEHVYRALQAGVRGYLLKESAGTEVVKAVRAVHAGRHYLDQPITDMVVEGYLAPWREASPLESLSPRERAVLDRVLDGETSATIGDLMGLSPKTIETYRARMMRKLGVKDFHELIRFAIRVGLIKPP